MALELRVEDDAAGQMQLTKSRLHMRMLGFTSNSESGHNPALICLLLACR